MPDSLYKQLLVLIHIEIDDNFLFIKTVIEHWKEIPEKAKSFAGTSKQRLAYLFSQFLKIKPTEKNIDDIADMLGQAEILEPDAKKRRNSAKRKQSKD